MLVRRSVPSLILVSVAASFVVSVTLLLAVLVADDSTRLCRGGSEDIVDQLSSSSDVRRQSSSVLRQLNVVLHASNSNNKLPVYA